MTDDLALTPDQTAEHERLLLACALQNADTARELLRTVQAPMIADGRLARAWSALRRVLAAETGPVDLAGAVATELAGEGGDALSLVDLHDLTREVPSAANAAYYAARVVDAHVRREAAGMVSEADLERNRDRPTAALLAGVEARARHLRELLAGPGAAAPVVVSAAEYADAPQPAPVVWRDNPDAPDSTGVDAVLSVGEVAILASAGGLGKSTLVLELASAAVAAAELGAPSMAACGLAVTAGPVVVVSFEDAPARIAHRLTWCNAGKVPAAVHVAPDPLALWVAAADRGGESHPGANWDRLWRAVREVDARLVVIDPVSAALADVSTTETGPVRAFLRALTAEATAAGAGVLLVAHSNKAGRRMAAAGEDPGADLVAGSAAWYDGARGVLSLVVDPEPGSSDRLLQCVKANYGRTGWGARLIERTGPGGAFRGLALGARMDRRADIDAAKRPPTKRDKENGSGKVGADVDTSEV